MSATNRVPRDVLAARRRPSRKPGTDLGRPEQRGGQVHDHSGIARPHPAGRCWPGPRRCGGPYRAVARPAAGSAPSPRGPHPAAAAQARGQDAAAAGDRHLRHRCSAVQPGSGDTRRWAAGYAPITVRAAGLGVLTHLHAGVLVHPAGVWIAATGTPQRRAAGPFNQTSTELACLPEGGPGLAAAAVAGQVQPSGGLR